MYAEFVACYGASSQAVWLRNLILELQVVDSISQPIVIYCDNNVVMSTLRTIRSVRVPSAWKSSILQSMTY